MIRLTGSDSPFLLTENPPIDQNALPAAEHIQRLAVQHELQEGVTPSSLVAVLESIKCRCNPDSTAVQAFISELGFMRERLAMDEESTALIAVFVRDMDPVLRARTGERLKECAISRNHPGNEKSRRLAAMLDDPLLAFSGALGRAEKELVKEAGSLRLEKESDLAAFSGFVEKHRESSEWIVRRLYARIAGKTEKLEKICLDAMLSHVREGDADMMKSVFRCIRRLDTGIQVMAWVSLIRQVSEWPGTYHEDVAEILHLRPLSNRPGLDDAFQQATILYHDAQGFEQRGDPIIATALKAAGCYILAGRDAIQNSHYLANQDHF